MKKAAADWGSLSSAAMIAARASRVENASSPCLDLASSKLRLQDSPFVKSFPQGFLYSWLLDLVNAGYDAAREHIHDGASSLRGGSAWMVISRPHPRML
jgi:hypothetical protein